MKTREQLMEMADALVAQCPSDQGDAINYVYVFLERIQRETAERCAEMAIKTATAVRGQISRGKRQCSHVDEHVAYMFDNHAAQVRREFGLQEDDRG